jgi:hypothetical protein
VFPLSWFAILLLRVGLIPCTHCEKSCRKIFCARPVEIGIRIIVVYRPGRISVLTFALCPGSDFTIGCPSSCLGHSLRVHAPLPVLIYALPADYSTDAEASRFDSLCSTPLIIARALCTHHIGMMLCSGLAFAASNAYPVAINEQLNPAHGWQTKRGVGCRCSISPKSSNCQRWMSWFISPVIDAQ